MRRCPECGAINHAAAYECVDCGATLRMRERVEITPAPLIETEHLRVMSYRDVTAWAGANPFKLHLVAQARGYKPGWAYHRMREARVS